MPGNIYRDFISSELQPQDTNIRPTLSQAVEVDPTREAKLRQFAREANLPTAVASALGSSLDQEFKVNRVDQDTAQTPVTRQAYGDPEFANLAHDDSKPLSALESLMVVPRGLASAAPAFNVGFYGLLETASGAVGLKGVRDFAGQQRGVAEATMKSWAGGDGGTWIGRNVQGAAQSVGQALPGLGAFLLGAPEAAVAAAFMIPGIITQAGQSAVEAKEAGKSDAQALFYGAQQGAWEGLLEKLPVDLLLKNIAKGTGTARLLAEQLATENITESLTTVAQNFTEWANLNPDKPFEDWAKEQPQAVLDTIVQTTLATGAITGAMVGINNVRVRAQARQQQAEKGARDAQFLDRLAKLAEASVLRERAPDVFADLVQRQAEAHGAPEAVYVTPEVFNQTFATPEGQEALRSMPQAVQDAVEQAMQTGGDVRIPISEFTTHVAPTPLYAQLQNDIKLDPNGLTRTEAEDFIKNESEQLRADIEAVLTKTELDEATSADRERLRATLKDQLDKTSRFTSDVNDLYASFAANSVAAVAARAGKTIDELLAENPLFVNAGDGQVIGADKLQADNEAFKAWFGESQIVDESGNPLVVYHGTDRDFSAFDLEADRRVDAGTGVQDTDTGWYGKGLYFTPSARAGQGYAGRDGKVYAVHLSIQKPFIVDREGGRAMDRALNAAGAPPPENGSWRRSSEQTAWLKSQGYDGVIVTDGPGGPTQEIVAFDPTQVKSVDNRGGYDPRNPNIYEQQGVAYDPGLGLRSAVFDYAQEKGPGRASAAQWLATLAKAPGVKTEELEWMGLKEGLEVLEAENGGQVSKEQVLNYIAKNGVHLVEVVEGGTIEDYWEDDLYREIESEITQRAFDRDYTEPFYRAVKGYRGGDGEGDYLVPEEDYDPETDDDVPEGAQPLWFVVDYDDTTGGRLRIVGEGKGHEEKLAATREMVRVLAAHKEEAQYEWEVPDWVSSAAYEEWELQRPRAQWESYALDGGSNYREFRLSMPREDNPPLEDDYREGHFPDPNIIAHFRTKDRTDDNGTEHLHLQEVQSSLHEAGRKKGYKTAPDPARVAATESELSEAKAAHLEAVSEVLRRIAPQMEAWRDFILAGSAEAEAKATAAEVAWKEAAQTLETARGALEAAVAANPEEENPPEVEPYRIAYEAEKTAFEAQRAAEDLHRYGPDAVEIFTQLLHPEIYYWTSVGREALVHRLRSDLLVASSRIELLGAKNSPSPDDAALVIVALNGLSRGSFGPVRATWLRVTEAESAYHEAILPSGIPNFPFKGEAWATLVLKRAIRLAVAEGKQAVSWIFGNQQNGETDAAGAWFYNRNLVNAANAFLKKYGAKVELMPFKGIGREPRGARPAFQAFTAEGIEAEFADEIAEAKAKIAEAKSDLAEISKPAWLGKADPKTYSEATKLAASLPEEQRAEAMAADPAWLYARETVTSAEQELASIIDAKNERLSPNYQWGFTITPELRAAVEQDRLTLFQEARGTFTPSTGAISLLRTANLSTFLHEFGHWHLETLARLASSENAPPQIRQDFETVLRWFGITGDETPTGGGQGGALAQGGQVSSVDPATGDSPNRISTRQPWTKRATEDALAENLVIGLEAMKQSPEAFAHNMEVIKDYPGFTSDATTPEGVAEDFIRFVEANLQYLYDRVPEQIRELSKLWYDGARAITDRWSQQYDVPDFTVAGVLAALSPQKDWYQNVSLAERVLDIHTAMTTGNQQSFIPTAEMQATAERIYAKDGYAEALKEVLSRPYAALDNDVQKAMWLRIYDETYNPGGFRVVSSDGQFIGEATGKIGWGSNVEIAKAIRVLTNQTREATSAAMGDKHKVRNFYNNILAPNAPHGDVTIDTHAVAAALLRPLAGSSPEVHHNFGTSPPTNKQPANWRPMKNIGDSGSHGSYGLYAEAYRRLAAKLGILPRELQSITWEAVRGLFPAIEKRNNKAKTAKVDAIWRKVETGELTADQARAEIDKLYGGIDDPTWHRPDSAAPPQTAETSYEGGLSGARLLRQPAGDMATGPGYAAGAGSPRGRRGAKRGRLPARDSLGNALYQGGEETPVAGPPQLPAGRTPLDVWNAMSLEEKRPYHEKFARGFEAYLFEGRSPSVEMRGIFQRFAAWMKSVYRDLVGLNVELTDEVRAVMDRLVATPEQIKAAEGQLGIAQAFAQKPDTMTDDEWEAYQRLGLEATTAAVDELQTRLVRDLRFFEKLKARALRDLKREVAEQRKVVRAEVRAEVMAEPVNRARQFLRRGTDADGNAVEGAGKLDAVAVSELYGDTPAELQDWKNLGFGRFGMLAKEGLNPDDVAERFGYGSGQALIEDLLNAEDANEKIAGLTDQRMLERYGDITSPEGLERAATEAVHNEAMARLLTTEYNVLAKAVGGRKMLNDEARSLAKQLVGRLMVKDLKPDRYLAAERRAARAAEEAIKANDLAAAAAHKRAQIINFFAARAVKEAQREVRKGQTLFSRIVTARNEGVSRSRDRRLVDATRAILAAYGLDRARNSVVEAMELVKSYSPDVYALVEPTLIAATANAKPIAQVTVDDFVALADTVKQLWALSRLSRQMTIEGRKVSLDEARQAILGQLAENPLSKLPSGVSEAPSKGARFLRALSGLRASLRRVESWVQLIDGGATGAWRTYVWQPISEAADAYRVARNDVLRRLVDVLAAVGPTLRRGKIDAREIGYTFGGGNGGVGKAELLHALLHTGNESNKRKLLLGRGWATESNDVLDTSRWDAFLDRMHQQGVITKGDWDFCQRIWDLLDELKPAAQGAHFELFGRYFSEVTADTVSTPFGQYRGGYVPALTDDWMVGDRQLQNEEDLLRNSDATMFPAPAKGFTMKRVEDYTKPLALDLGILARHVDQVLKFSHLAVPTRDALRLLRTPAVGEALQAVDPTAMSDLLMPWLNRAAKQITETPTKGVGGKAIDNVFRLIRARTGMALMVGNVINALQQTTGLSVSAVLVKPRYMTASLWTYLRDPKGSAQAAADLSEFMATRTSQAAYEARAQLDELLLDPTRYEKLSDWADRHAYALQTWTQGLVDTITWQAAYAQAVDDGQSEAEAVRFANGVVRQTQGSFAAEDVSRAETGAPLTRALMQFYSYFNGQSNLLGTEFARAARDGDGSRAAWVYLTGIMLPAVLAELIKKSLAGEWDDDDENAFLMSLLDLFFGSQARYVAGLVPVAGAFAMSGIERLFTGQVRDDRVGSSPAATTLSSAVGTPAAWYRVVTKDGQGLGDAVRDTLSLVTLSFGGFAGAVAAVARRPAGYTADVIEGKVNPTGPLDVARGLVTGRASPASKE